MTHASAVQRFCRLPTPSFEKIFADANTILDEIISQCHTYRRPNQDLNPEEITRFLLHGCAMLQNASILLKSKFAQVINIYLPLMKNAVNEQCVNILVQFLCRSLQNIKSSLVSEFLKALSLTLVGNGAFLCDENVYHVLGEEGVVWSYLRQSDWILKSYAIQSVGNLCLRSTHAGVLSKENIQFCYSKLLNLLWQFVFEDKHEIEYFRLISVTLKSLQKVLSGVTLHDNIVEPAFVVMLLKIFLVYGCPAYHISIKKLRATLPSRNTGDTETMEKIYPTKKKEKSTMTKKVNARKIRKKKKKHPSKENEDALDSIGEGDLFSMGYDVMRNWRQLASASSSESEYSDADNRQTEEINSVMIKIRYNCAITLQEILRCCDRRSRFACWLSLLPDNISNDEPSLLHSFITESSMKIKTAILLPIMELCDGSKGFLDSVMTVQNNPSLIQSSRPFTPYSVKVNQSLHLIHDQLMSAIEKEVSHAVKDKILKCLTLLMLNTPYKKIGKNYLMMIMRLVANFLHSTELSLCQSTLTCLAACISIDPENKDMLNLLTSSSFPSSGEQQNQSANGDCWLVRFCLSQLKDAAKENAKELRLSSEYTQLLTVILRNHPQLLRHTEVEQLVKLLVNVFMFSSDVSVSFHAIKLLEEFSKYYNNLYEKTKEDKEGVIFWKKMLTSAIPQYLHEQPAKPSKGQAAICDWISNIGNHMFDMMKNSEQIFIKTVLIGLTENEEPLVAAAAVRSLGVIIDYDIMTEDVWFVIDATRSILKQLSNGAISVRLKAAWSMANLCDFLAKHDFFCKDYPESMILNLLQDATKAALNNEKISPNGVRAIGNLLKSFHKKFFESEKFKCAIDEAINALIKNITTGQMKTRWNACYACRYIFENEDCPVGSATWTIPLFSALLEALRDCKNFKVRISAATALSSMKLRHCFGSNDTFSDIWKQTLDALEKSEELTDFTEFKHKENLQEQTTLLLLHLLSIANKDDLRNFRLTAKDHQDLLLSQCKKCVEKVEGKLDDKLTAIQVYIDVSDPIGRSTEDAQKCQVIVQHIDKFKDNLCAIKNLDRNKSTIEIIVKALDLAT